jgi:hypothetical protein
MASTTCRYANLNPFEWLEGDCFVTESPSDGLRIWKLNFENGIIRELKPRIKKHSKIRKLKGDPLYTFHYYFTTDIFQYF